MSESNAQSALESMVGKKMPGSCPDCRSYTTVEKQQDVFVMVEHHDRGCPWYRRRDRSRRRGGAS